MMLSEMRNLMHAKLCYHLFITPLPVPIEKEYRDFANRACEFFSKYRSESVACYQPRHYVIHRFAQINNPHAKKVLVAHGWMSRAAYMIRMIKALHQEGYEVYAIDFPAHGEAKGWQLPWIDAVAILRETLNNFGPFYGVVGHSFGGSMLLNTLNLSNQLPEWSLTHEPQKAIFVASPTRMRTPVSKMARRLRLNGAGLVQLRNVIRYQSATDINYLNYRNFIKYGKIPVLCIHGQKDLTVSPQESIIFCQSYPYASLALYPDIDHVDVLIDPRIEQRIIQFFE